MIYRNDIGSGSGYQLNHTGQIPRFIHNVHIDDCLASGLHQAEVDYFRQQIDIDISSGKNCNAFVMLQIHLTEHRRRNTGGSGSLSDHLHFL